MYRRKIVWYESGCKTTKSKKGMNQGVKPQNKKNVVAFTFHISSDGLGKT